MRNYTRTFETPAEAMEALNLKNTHKVFKRFIDMTYYSLGVYQTAKLMDNGDQMLVACHYCTARDLFVINYQTL